MPDDTQPPAPDRDGPHSASSSLGQEPSAIPGPPGAGGSPQAAGSNPFAASAGPYGQNPHPAGPNPHGPGQNPYAAGSNPYGPGHNPYAAGPNPYGFGPAPYAAYPGQPAPARPGRALIHAIWLAVMIVVAIITGSVAYDVGTHHSQQPVAPPPAAAPQKPVVAPPPVGAYQCQPTDAAAGSDSRLIGELLPVPAGATRPSSAPRPKAYTLHAYVTNLYTRSDVSHEQALLQARCFQTAVNGEWQTAGGTIVSIWLVQFADNGGARSYALGQEQTDLNLMGKKGRSTTISEVSDGMLIQDPGLDQYGNTFTRVFGDRGNVMILIHVYVPGQWASESSMAALLRAQASRISAGPA